MVSCARGTNLKRNFANSIFSCLPVLGPGDDRSSDIPAGGDNPRNREFPEQDVQPSGGWQLPAESNWSLPAVPQAALEESFQQTLDDGLYWLWDMTWNGVDQ